MANERDESLSAKLRAQRAKKNLTQAQVAQSLGISQQTYSNYENKDAAIDSNTLKAICLLYGVSADYLLGINVPPVSEAEDFSYNPQNDEKLMSLITDFYNKVKTESKTSADNHASGDGER